MAHLQSVLVIIRGYTGSILGDTNIFELQLSISQDENAGSLENSKKPATFLNHSQEYIHYKIMQDSVKCSMQGTGTLKKKKLCRRFPKFFMLLAYMFAKIYMMLKVFPRSGSLLLQLSLLLMLLMIILCPIFLASCHC